MADSRDKLRKAYGEPTKFDLKEPTLPIGPRMPTSSRAESSRSDATSSSARPRSENESLLSARGRTNQLRWFPRLGISTACTLLFDSTKGGTVKDMIFSNAGGEDRNIHVFITNIEAGNWTNYPDFAGISDNTKDYVYLLQAFTVSANTTTTLSKACGLLNPISSDGDPRNNFYIYAFAGGQRIDVTLVL